MARLTWTSNEDVIEDIRKFNEFGDGDKDESSHLVTDRTQMGEDCEEFIDPRTGEKINVDYDPDNNDHHVGKGGIHHIEEYVTYLSLQKQLRMIRPLGSGNEMIETYFAGNSSQDSTSGSYACSSQAVVTDTSFKGKEDLSDEVSFVKAKRKKSTKNVLMSNLLDKLHENSENDANQTGKSATHGVSHKKYTK